MIGLSIRFERTHRCYNDSLRSSNMSSYKVSSCKLRRTVKVAKKRYRDKVEAQLCNRNSRMWQGLQRITNYRGGTNTPAVADSSLVEYLNSLYARFDNSVSATSIMASMGNSTREDCPLSHSEHDVRRALR